MPRGPRFPARLEDTAEHQRSNSADAKKYQEVCHSVYGESAYSAMLNFAHNVARYVPDVAFSVVRGFLSENDIEICQSIADDAGVRLRIREYIS